MYARLAKIEHNNMNALSNNHLFYFGMFYNKCCGHRRNCDVPSQFMNSTLSLISQNRETHLYEALPQLESSCRPIPSLGGYRRWHCSSNCLKDHVVDFKLHFLGMSSALNILFKSIVQHILQVEFWLPSQLLLCCPRFGVEVLKRHNPQTSTHLHIDHTMH